jgi:biotin-dependent carboxylase-like uncharacterized protein
MSGTLSIQQPGHSVVTDLGRFRGPRFGLPANGALDQRSARVANILVGNTENAPLLEITALDFRARPDTDLLVCVTGTPLTFTVDGRPSPQWEPVVVRAGETIVLSALHTGLRAYLAIRGSVDAPVLLGSCAPDTVVGFGLKLSANDRLTTQVSTPPIRQPHFDLPLFGFGVEFPRYGNTKLIDVTDGPDVEEFGDSADLLFTSRYSVSGRSNHIGLRLGGALPERQRTGEILSRGVPVGAIEVPSREELLVLHRGRGVTAGYPVLGVVTSQSLDTLAQARPGDTILFRRSSVAAAAARRRTEMDELEKLRGAVERVFTALGLAPLPAPDGAATSHDASHSPNHLSAHGAGTAVPART